MLLPTTSCRRAASSPESFAVAESEDAGQSDAEADGGMSVRRSACVRGATLACGMALAVVFAVASQHAGGGATGRRGMSEAVITEQMVVNPGDSPVVCNGFPGPGRLLQDMTMRASPADASDGPACFAKDLDRFLAPLEPRLECWADLQRTCVRNWVWKLTWQELSGIAPEIIASNHSSKPFLPLADSQTCDWQFLGASRVWTPHEMLTAAQWFRENVHVYVVNLPKDKERWASIQSRLTELGIEAERVDGVYMKEPDALANAKKEGLIPESFDIKQAEANAWDAGMDGIVGRVGCASAHLRAQRRAMQGGKPLAVVFEDDVVPATDFVYRLWQLVTEELPCDWDAVALNSHCPFGRCISPHLSRVHPTVKDPKDRCRYGGNFGFQSVLYRTDRLQALQDRLRPVAFDLDRPHCLDVDVALASVSDVVNFYAVPFSQYPGFVFEANFGSSRYLTDQQVPDGVTRSTTTEATTTGPLPVLG